MKGFIIGIQKAKNEDLIVTILSPDSIQKYYRFYGARHSIIQLGYFIDFESEDENSRFMPRLRRVSQFHFEWLYSRNRLLHWQNFIKLFETHLRDTKEISPFYFDTLLEASKKWNRQNPKRIICEAYYKVLKFEGRLHTLDKCYICEEALKDEISLMRAMIPAHPECIYSPALSKDRLSSYFETGKTTWLEDFEVDYLYQVIMKGF